jgi:prepilin-type processing-associated H-X9-DG protein
MRSAALFATLLAILTAGVGASTAMLARHPAKLTMIWWVDGHAGAGFSIRLK